MDERGRLLTISLDSGSAGDIKITTGGLTVRKGSKIDASTNSDGRGGNVDVVATNLLEVDGGGSSAQLSTKTFYGGGNAGNLNLTTKKLLARDGGQISSSTLGTGNAGTININASGSVEVSGSGVLSEQVISSALFAQTATGESTPVNTVNGNGGNLNINTGRLVVQNEGIISVAAVRGSTGQAGNLSIKANSLSLNRGTRPDSLSGVGVQ